MTTPKLNEFRLETYDERAALLYAITVMKAARPDYLYTKEIDALALRLSRTECQPGGCSYCSGEPEDYDRWS